ncbi:MAG: type II toxin-antitoxin system VapC family toxin [Acidimicrobiales bacterium]
MLVIDTSAAVEALVAREPPPGLVERLASDGDLHAPHLIDVEVLHALRRLNLGGELSDDRAEDARFDFSELSLVRYPHAELGDRIWQLRRNLTAYDATFVALAERLEVPLVTCDRRLGQAAGHRAIVEVFVTS